MRSPKKHTDIVVLIPHYNNLSGLKKSLQSIHYKGSMCVVVVDDGSTTCSVDDLERLQLLLPYNVQLHVLSSNKNKGIEAALNKGLIYIKVNFDCPYIARLDCGDTCSPDRFALQKLFLDNNIDYYLVGSWVTFESPSGKELFTVKPPQDEETIRKKMHVSCSFIHPAVMFRTQALEQIGFYPKAFKAAEDYAFFFRFTQNYKTANISAVLTRAELNPKGISLTNRRVQLWSRLKVLCWNLKPDVNSVYGILRTACLLCLPYKTVERLKIVRSK